METMWLQNTAAIAPVASSRREDRRVVKITAIAYLLEEPGRRLRDGESRCPISNHRQTDDVFQPEPSSSGIIAEFFWAHLVHEAMRVSVRGNLVSSFCSFADQMRKAFRHPSKEEACHQLLLFTEEIQEAQEVCLHSRRQRPPFGKIRRPRDVENVKPVLDINGERAFRQVLQVLPRLDSTVHLASLHKP